MNLLLIVFAAASLFLIGIVRLLRSAPDASASERQDDGKTAAYFGLAALIIAALAWYPLILSGLLMLIAPVPALLGAYALAVARKPAPAIIGAICYTVPFFVVWAFTRHASL